MIMWLAAVAIREINLIREAQRSELPALLELWLESQPGGIPL